MMRRVDNLTISDRVSVGSVVFAIKSISKETNNTVEVALSPLGRVTSDYDGQTLLRLAPYDKLPVKE